MNKSSRQWVVGSGQSAVGNQQSAVGSQQSTVSSESGIVLVALLWIFIALSAIVLSFAREGHVEVAAANNTQSLEKAYYVARAGLSETIYRLIERQFNAQSQQMSSEDEPTPLELGRISGNFGGGSYIVNIQDESGKINLNSVSEEQLLELALATGIPQPDAGIITDSILDWIDNDDSLRSNGAEDDYYQTLNPPYTAKNGPMDTIEELLLVQGVSPEYFFGVPEKDIDGSIFYRYGLSRYLTVYSSSTQINVNYAPIPVLRSIPGMSQRSAEEIYQIRQTKPFENTSEISGELSETLGITTLQYLTTQGTSTFTLNVTAQTDNSKVRRVIRAVVNLDGSQDNFHRILYWNESVPAYESATL